MEPLHDTSPEAAGYWELLRTNREFRRLWIGEVASHLGDWFNTIAVYVLVERLTGSPLALGWAFISKSLPFALASPLAGMIVDRWDRRRLMIAADLLRAVIVLGLLAVQSVEHVAWVYVLGALQMVVSAVFIPARSAVLPNITTARELLTANALSAATWSTLLAVGAALGGLVTDWLGTSTVFVIDSLTYVVSAVFLWTLRVPRSDVGPVRGSLVRSAAREVLEGWRYLQVRPGVARMAFVKSAWAIGGGGLVYMLALVGAGLVPGAPAVGIGWLYAARGLGTGIGPIAARAWVPQRRRWGAMIGLGIVSTGAFYLLVGRIEWSLAVLLVLVTLAHTTSGANWVASTVILQERTEDRYRGRVFSSEWLVLTAVDTVSILSASVLLETGVLTLPQGILLFGAIQVAVGVVWLLSAARREAAAYEG